MSNMHSRVSVIAVAVYACLILAVTPAFAQENLWLYVGSARGDDANIIDMNTFKVVGDIKAGERVHGVCTDPEGKRLFLTVETDHTLRIIDTPTRTQIGVVKVSGKPNECAVTPNGKYVAVPIRDGDL